jgi:hypothetical protein
MVKLECPLCDGAVLVAFEAPELRCGDCAISVELDVVEFALAAAA